MSELLSQSGQSYVGDSGISGAVQRGEAFLSLSTWDTVDFVIINAARIGDGKDVTVTIYSTPYTSLDEIPIGDTQTSATVGTVTVNSSGWSTSFVDKTFTFSSPINVSAGVYFLVVSCPSGDASNRIKWAYTSFGSTPGRLLSVDSGVTITHSTGGAPKIHQIWGTVIPPPGKAQNPTPTDDQEDIKITGKDQLKKLQWEAPA